MKLALLFLSLSLIASSCTVSMQNVSTHGQATDLIDDALDTSPNVSPELTIPAVG